MQTPYTVPEIARITGIPETTLYDYVRQFTGIVPEVDPTEENGRTRRRYPEQAIAVFQTIRHLKDRGVDLPTIRALLQEGSPPRETVPSDLDPEPVRLIEDSTGPTIAETSLDAVPETLTTSEIISSEVESEQPAIQFAPTESAVPTQEISESLTQEPSLEETANEITTSPTTADPVLASVLSPAVIVPEDLTREPAPVETGADLVALQGQLLGSLEEGLRGLRDLLNTQNLENNRLREELRKEREALQNERQVNSALRADLAGQKDQNRSAERLLALIKNHCEEGIQSIAT